MAAKKRASRGKPETKAESKKRNHVPLHVLQNRLEKLDRVVRKREKSEGIHRKPR